MHNIELCMYQHDQSRKNTCLFKPVHFYTQSCFKEQQWFMPIKLYASVPVSSGGIFHFFWCASFIWWCYTPNLHSKTGRNNHNSDVWLFPQYDFTRTVYIDDIHVKIQNVIYNYAFSVHCNKNVLSFPFQIWEQSWHFLKFSLKSIHNLLSYTTHNQTDRQTDKPMPVKT